MNRRSLIAALPLAGIPDFSAPLAARSHNPDADLIALCDEHGRQWDIANEAASQADSEAATEETTRLGKLIASTPATSPAGLRGKAWVLARETGYARLLTGASVYPCLDECDAGRVLLSLLADLTGTHGNVVVL